MITFSTVFLTVLCATTTSFAVDIDLSEKLPASITWDGSLKFVNKEKKEIHLTFSREPIDALTSGMVLKLNGTSNACEESGLKTAWVVPLKDFPPTCPRDSKDLGYSEKQIAEFTETAQRHGIASKDFVVVGSTYPITEDDSPLESFSIEAFSTRSSKGVAVGILPDGIIVYIFEDIEAHKQFKVCTVRQFVISP